MRADITPRVESVKGSVRKKLVRFADSRKSGLGELISGLSRTMSGAGGSFGGPV
jgi:hypothetical protein